MKELLPFLMKQNLGSLLLVLENESPRASGPHIMTLCSTNFSLPFWQFFWLCHWPWGVAEITLNSIFWPERVYHAAEVKVELNLKA